MSVCVILLNIELLSQQKLQNSDSLILTFF